jgi:hypothetical protein
MADNIKNLTERYKERYKTLPTSVSDLEKLKRDELLEQSQAVNRSLIQKDVDAVQNYKKNNPVPELGDISQLGDYKNKMSAYESGLNSLPTSLAKISTQNSDMNFIPELSVNSAQASEYSDALPGEYGTKDSVQDVTTSKNPNLSSEQKAQKLVANKPTMKSPVISPETQAAGIGEKPVAVDPSKDIAMEQAQEEDKSEKMRRLLFEGIAGLGSGQQVTQSKEFENNVANLVSGREQQLKKMQVAEEAAKNDPKSPVSIAMRDALKGMGVSIPENATYATMEKLAPQIMKNKEFQIRMQDIALRNKELDISKADKQNQQGLNRIQSSFQSLNSNEAFRTLKKKMGEGDQIEAKLKLIKNGNSIATGQIGANLARFLGEVGVLTENDINRYQTSPKYADKIASWISKGGEGSLPDGAIKELQEGLKVAKAIYKRQHDDLLNSYKTSLKTTTKLNDAVDSAFSGLEINDQSKTQDQISQTVHMVSPNGQEYDVPADKVEEAKKNGWKVK